MIVDVHAHAMLPAVQRVAPLMLDLDERLAKMDAQGVDVQLVSTSPAHYHSWAPADIAGRLARAIGEEIAALCERSDRLVGLGYAPLQHPDVAETALVEAVGELGLRGVEIPSYGGSVELGSPELEPFWAKAEEAGALVFVHPWGCTLGARLSRFFMSNLAGQPVENALAITQLVLSGLLERRPGLRILIAHGSGYLPFHPGRMDHAWEVRPELTTTERPCESLRRLYYDSLVYEPELLEALVARIGADPGAARIGLSVRHGLRGSGGPRACGGRPQRQAARGDPRGHRGGAARHRRGVRLSPAARETARSGRAAADSAGNPRDAGAVPRPRRWRCTRR